MAWLVAVELIRSRHVVQLSDRRKHQDKDNEEATYSTSMALIQDDSHLCSTSSFELFDTLPTQDVVEDSRFVEILPLNSNPDGAAYDFYVPALTDEYLDVSSTRLYVKAQIVKADGTAIGADAAVAPVNDLFNSLWSNIEFSMNGRAISQSNNMYAYTSMISNLIHNTEEAVKSEGSMRLFYKDTPNQMDVVEPRKANHEQLIPNHDIEATVAGNDTTYAVIAAATVVGNNGLYQRYLPVRAGKEFEMKGPLRVDFFEQLRYLPPGHDIKLRLHRNNAEFTLMSATAGQRIKLIDVRLLVRKVRPSPGVLLGHQDALKKMTAKFPIIRKECKEFAVAENIRSVKKDHIFLGQLPKRVVIAMVDADAAAGLRTKNPFNFQHYNMNRIQLYADGTPVRSQELRPKIADGDYMETFETLTWDVDKEGGETSLIKLHEWDKGYALVAFDLTPDMNGDDHYSLIKHGNLRLEVEFGEALPRSINILVYAEFENVLETTADHNILYDYT